MIEESIFLLEYLPWIVGVLTYMSLQELQIG